MKIGFIGCGNISKTMAYTINEMHNKEIELYAVSARDLARANEFKEKYGAKVAYGSYEELCQDSNVDLVYVATPHSHHYRHIMLALTNNKAVLCEKAFTMNAMEAEACISYAREHKLFLSEAIWTRYMPSRRIISDLVNSNVVGHITSLSANLGYTISNVERLKDPRLCGGALLDVGVYPTNFALMCFGNDYKSIEASCLRSDEGVDLTNNFVFYYKDKVAHMHSTMLASTDRRGYIYGDNGYIRVDNVNNPYEIRIYNKNHLMTRNIIVPQQITGYEYQLLECNECLNKGLTEAPSMPLDETLFVMKTFDKIRQKMGIKYPME